MANLLKRNGEEMVGKRSNKCSVCSSRDRDLIESLCAAGAYISDVSVEFGLQQRVVRKHEALHSTKLPSVDPLAILRHMRWLQEQTDTLLRRVVDNGGGAMPSTKTMDRRAQMIELSLKVTRQLAELTNARKYMDPHVMLPRYNNLMMKLADVFKNDPKALSSIVKFMKENATADVPAGARAERYIQHGGKYFPLEDGGNDNGGQVAEGNSTAGGEDKEGQEEAPDSQERSEEERKET